MVLQAVYDASPLVRAEVAVGLARLAESHSVLFQVHILYLPVMCAYLVYSPQSIFNKSQTRHCSRV